MYRRHRQKAQVLFALSDVLITVLAFVGAYYTRRALTLERVFYLDRVDALVLLSFCAFAWVLIGRWLNLYDELQTRHPLAIVNKTFQQSAFGGVGLILFQYILRLDLSRPFIGLIVAYSGVGLLLFRLSAGKLVGAIRLGFGTSHNVVIVGEDDRALRLAESLERSEEYGVRLIGFVSAENGSLEESPRKTEIQLRGTYPVHALAALPELLKRAVVDEIIFAVNSKVLAELEDVLLLCDEEGVRTRVSVDFFPHVNSEIYLDHLYSTPLLTFAAAPDDELRLMVKRATDFCMAAAGLVVLLPFIVVVVLLIMLTSRGPVIFRQVRCGLNGRRFVLYKFRSMCLNAEELKPSLQHLNEKSTTFKISDDPRVTSVGRYLRKFSVDEWPQLWNVLKGDMSLVGPRPAIPEEVEQYRRWQRRRLRMRPGLTCLWTLAGRDSLDFETCMRMDMQYIDNWSLGLDWMILLKTIPHVVIGKGAH